MQIFLDCDGVLADLEGSARVILNEHLNVMMKRIGEPAVWDILRQASIFSNLSVLDDGRRLFNALQHLQPIILTGCPRGGWAEQQKIEWAARHFPGVPLIPCASKDKRLYMQHPGDILIDDYLKYRSLWEQAGGVFIQYLSFDQAMNDLLPYLEERNLPLRASA